MSNSRAGGRPAHISVEREAMVARQIADRGVSDPLVLAAMRTVPRERFVLDTMAEFAYEDTPLPIEAGQTISQPYIVARMLELAEIGPGDRVLEVGAGSGYAAAVMSRIASRVFAIERHAILANTARHRIDALGYDNVMLYHRDGTAGLPEEAPFDAIIVSAGGEQIPEELKVQLAIGGRLVIPIGGHRRQVLKRIVRRSAATFDEEDHGVVMFVPLVSGGDAVTEGSVNPPLQRLDDTLAIMHTAAASAKARLREKTPERRSVPELIRDAAERFDDLEQLSVLVDRYAGRKIVLLGESTHGTSEFYQARTWITERLVALHGFEIVAVEADWPDAAAYDAYIRKRPAPQADAPAFMRFPQWMWRNAEVQELLERLLAANERKSDKQRWAGFYGLDLYSMSASISAVLAYLDRVDPEAARIARERYGCLAPWRANPARYGRMALREGFRRCEDDVARILMELLEKRLSYLRHDGDEFFSAARNARLVAEAERYYRTMYYGAASSWNLRDRHMFETLEAVLDHRGPQAKAVVWAHNSHIGDASFTEMGRVRDEINLGQLCRQRYGAEVALIGFGTDRGTVAAASDWDGSMEIKTVRAAHEDSFEGLCRASGIASFLLDLGLTEDERLRSALTEPMLERAIGVIYRPETERASHYFEAEPAQQFDAWVWFEETRAVSAARRPGLESEAETYPFGL